MTDTGWVSATGPTTDHGLGPDGGDARPPTGPSPRPPDQPGFVESTIHFVSRLVALVVAGWRRLRQWNRRDGAGESGLAQLIEVHVLQTAGDATVAVALAGSLFFSVPTHEARSRVALYLLLTVAPFAVVAPILGPLLDRFRHGRRIAIATTMVVRAILALVIAHSLDHGVEAITLYPAALGVLIAGKAYTVARAAALPRLVPPQLTLVTSNARLTVAGVIAPMVAGAFAIAVRTTLGASDELLLGMAVYIIGAVATMRLPATADGGTTDTEHIAVRPGLGLRGFTFPIEVLRALTSAAALRWMSGFVLFYGAFVVREHSLGHLSGNEALVVLGAGIGIGNFLGTTAGARVRQLRAPRIGILLVGVTTVFAVLVALKFALLTAAGLALVGAATAAMTKLALDSTIQDRVDDSVRSSTFGRSETTMQLAWVIGGVVGILLPTNPTIGFTVASAVAGGFVVGGVIVDQRAGMRHPAGAKTASV